MGYDKILTAQLKAGFSYGFDLGYRSFPNSDKNIENSVSTSEHPDVVDKALEKEVCKGRMVGPLKEIPFTQYQINPLAIVPKKSGEYRLITNLSSPAGNSINDAIHDIFAEVHYASIKDALKILLVLGKGAFLAKTDVKSAFRLIPVSPEQYHLLCYKWQGHFYIDKCLPMGARSSCQIFERFSTSLEFIVKQLGCPLVIHYLDDFLFLSSTEQGCRKALKTFQFLAEDIGLPLAPEKTVLPSCCVEFLGYEIDTSEEIIRLPNDKILKGIKLLEDLLYNKYATLQELQAVAGFLNFACAVMVPGRAYMNCFYSLMAKLKMPFHRTKIKDEAKEDIRMWLKFFSQYNGVSFYREQMFLSQEKVHIFSDASKTLGFGGWLGTEWFSGEWPSEWYLRQNIVLLEMIPVLIALKLYSSHLLNKVAVLHIDNEALVAVLNNMKSKEPLVMNFVRQVVLYSMKYNFLIKAVHVVGAENYLADKLSRSQVAAFLKAHPTANPCPTAFKMLPAQLSCKSRLLD